MGSHTLGGSFLCQVWCSGCWDIRRKNRPTHRRRFNQTVPLRLSSAWVVNGKTAVGHAFVCLCVCVFVCVDISCCAVTSRTSPCQTSCRISYTKTAKTSTYSLSSWTGSLLRSSGQILAVTTISHERREQFDNIDMSIHYPILMTCLDSGGQRSKVKVTAGLSMWWRRYPRRLWAPKSTFYFWRTWTHVRYMLSLVRLSFCATDFVLFSACCM